MNWISHVVNSFWDLSCQHYLYFLLACSTRFHVAILFWSLIHCKIRNLGSNPNFLLCNIPFCDISFKLFASSEAFFHLSLYIFVIVVVIWKGWCLTLH